MGNVLKPAAVSAPAAGSGSDEPVAVSAPAAGSLSLSSGKRDVWMYLILKLAELLRINNKVGPVAWSFHEQVKDLHYSYVWAHGGREQRQALSANVMEDGHQWWPVIWVEMDGVLKPVYCPGLAWMGTRPMAEVDKPRVVIDELDDEWQIVDVTDV